MLYRDTSILVIRLSSLGDVLMTIPAVRALRGKYPDAHISWLVEGSVGEILKHQRFIDEVISFPRSVITAHIRKGRLVTAAKTLSVFLKELRKRDYDVIADYHGIAKSAILSRVAHGDLRIGFGRSFAKEQTHITYDEKIDNADTRIHKIERNMLISRHLGTNGSMPQSTLTVSSDTYQAIDESIRAGVIPSPFIAVNPFSSRAGAYKRWDLERYRQLIEQIGTETGAGIVILWGPGEEEEARSLVAGSVDNVVMAPPTNVPELFALLSRSAMYVGGDTGVMHLAASTGKPVVAIFGPTDHVINAPYGRHCSIIRKDISCSPCKKKDCTARLCLESITTDEVMAEIKRIYRDRNTN